MKGHWYKNAIIYSLDVKTFLDSNGDGVGDFIGLTRRLDYISGLGITCLWVMPFYLSPNRDNGYDVQDYYQVDPRLGCLGDFVEFTYQARALGIRVIIDLVVNHTSNQHHWFKEARKNRNSKYHAYYVWSDEMPEEQAKNALEEEGVWTYDNQAKAYYLHRFYKEQPDLNISNPDVREEIKKVMAFWLHMGVSGFRVDAAHMLTETVGLKHVDREYMHELLTEMREFITTRDSEAVLLAEANVKPKELGKYFGNGNRMHLLFNFFLNKHLFLALAREEAAPIVAALTELQDIQSGQWANFVRHHDELNLEMLTKKEQEEIFSQFAPDEDMRIFGHGIRRRLPAMLHNDRRWIELTYSLSFSLPGTPLLYYGEEIGMGDDLSLEGRMSVRTVMQWVSNDHGGFSTAPPKKWLRPVIEKGEFSYRDINVVDQQRDSHSLLNWMERLIRTRKQCVELGFGTWDLIQTDHPAVFAHCCIWEDRQFIAVHNLSASTCEATLQLNEPMNDHFIYVFGNVEGEPISKDMRIRLKPYGYCWVRINSFN
jgi:maltose alpha-D-glucosyltransferase / alpha-amylase